MKQEDMFEATYAVPMHCQGCADGIQRALDGLPATKEVQFDIAKQLMVVKSSIAPSAIIETVQQKCGRDVIIRGAGASNSSAVCILEGAEGRVKGLVRMVEVDGGRKTLVDITLNGVEVPGVYKVRAHQNGDISRGMASVGAVFHDFRQDVVCADASGDGSAGDKLYSGKLFFSASEVPIWTLIGRSITATTLIADHSSGLVGVIARSAGVWENDKQVCACSGKTVWQERKDAIEHNIKH